jgi:repressor LexA
MSFVCRALAALFPALNDVISFVSSQTDSVDRRGNWNSVYSYSMQALTDKQRALAEFIESHRRERGSAPTYQEIADHFRFRSVNAVTSHIRLLRQKGYLASDSGKTRSLRVITPLAKLRGRIVDIPLLGGIPAGFPEAGEPEAEGCVSVDIGSVGFTPTRNTFAVRVRGVSMIGRHILDGDLVVLERGPDPRDGQVVAALVDGERTLKTYVVKNGKPYLKAENPKFPNLIPAQELVIQGVFKALIRKAQD